MLYNSIYGNTFKLNGQNNLINIPDFFFKIYSKINNNKGNKENLKLNKSHNRANADIIQSEENLLIKKYDVIIDNKKDLMLKRKNSACNILKLRKHRKIEKDDYYEITNKKDNINKEKENNNETDATDRNRNKEMKLLSQKSFKNKSFLSSNVKNQKCDFGLQKIHKKNLICDFPNLSKSKKKFINNTNEYDKNFKENYANLRNFLGHLFYMKKKYKLNKTIPDNLMLGNSKNNGASSKNDDFKEQVNNLINKLKNKKKEINNKKTLNLCIVNVGSPLHNFQKDFIYLPKNLLSNKHNIMKTKYNDIAHIKSPKYIKDIMEKLGTQKIQYSKIVKLKHKQKNNNEEKIKINNNINQIIKKYNTDVQKNNFISNRNSRNSLTKSNSSAYSNMKKNNSTALTKKKLMIKKKETKPNLFSNTKNFYKQYISEKIIDKLFSKEMIISDFDRRFSAYDLYYYKLNKMYCDQISLYMNHRINWELVENDEFDDSYSEQRQLINFEWRYYPNKLYYKKYKYNTSTPIKKLCAINLFEKNYEVGNKKKMFIHLINYCDKVNLNVFNYIPFTVIINNTKYLDDELQAFREIMSLVDANKYKSITERNRTDFILNKKYNEQFWFETKLEQLKNQNIYINKNFLSHKNYWILKPTDLYQGKCIEISNIFGEISKKCKKIFTGVDKTAKPESIDDDNKDNKDLVGNKSMSESYFDQFEFEYIQKKKKKSNIYISNELIIQKYLDNPLLYRKRKFDIRCFALVDWNLNVYFCREGHLKASSFIYDINNINKFIHITNHSFQKKSNKFEQFETGNEISYAEFKKFLIEEKIPLSNFDKIIKKMKFLVKLSFQAVGNKMMKTPDVLSFELFGYDFIIDNEYNPWILEINNNPGLSISSPVIEKIIPRMMDDAFRLTIDKIFNTRYSKECFDENKNYKSKFKLDGYNDNENIFEFLCNVKGKDEPENTDE